MSYDPGQPASSEAAQSSHNIESVPTYAYNPSPASSDPTILGPSSGPGPDQSTLTPPPPPPTYYNTGAATITPPPSPYDTTNTPPPPPPYPDVAVPARKKSHVGLWITLIILVLLIAGGAATFFILTNPSRTANSLVQNYYNAVEQQDYATAYTYIDSQDYNTGGLQIRVTRNAYTIAERTTDLTEGKVTDYHIVNITVNGNTATVTVDVTRRGIVREVDVELVQINGNWKIDKIAQD